MPYRRLPNTDEARLRALKTALKKAENTMPPELAFNASDFIALKRLAQALEHAMIGHKNTYSERVKKNKEYIASFKKTKLYISHFIQVLNLSIIRNEMPKTVRKMYGLELNDKAVPNMSSEADIIEWGKKIIDGEKERTSKGGSPIYNPKIAVVKIEYEKFLDLHYFQKTLQGIHDRSSSQLNELRSDVDGLILKIWNQTEAHFASEFPEVMRQGALEYGLVYVYRRKEKLLYDL
jgi:hypothetical protein